jgi:hypothetical protein
MSNDMVPGAKGSFTVDFEVSPDGKVMIGCKSFTPNEVKDVAKGLKVTRPPLVTADAKAGDLFGSDKDGRFYFFIAAGADYNDGLTLWNLTTGTYAGEEYWMTAKGFGKFFPVAKDGKYLDSCGNRYRRGLDSNI